MHAVVIDKVEKRFGAVSVLKSVSLDIDPGDFTVLLGASGCGKSTLLSILAGLEEPSSGTLSIGGHEVTDLPPKDRDVAMVFQSYALYPTMSVQDNLSFGLRMAKVPADEIKRRVKWASDLLQLEPLLKRKPAQLSGGQRQRVAIGRAIVREAKVYLFDEPLSNLDAQLRGEMRNEIRRLHARLGATMVYVTHDQVEAMTMATRIAVLRAGMVEQYAPPKEIYDRPNCLYVAGFIGSPGMNFLPGTLAADGGALRFQLKDSTEVRLDGYALAAPLQGRREAVLGVRPEDLRLDGGVPLLVSQAVESTELLGADTIVWLSWQGRRIAVRCAPAQAPRAGDRVTVGFEPARASVFDAGNERRL